MNNIKVYCCGKEAIWVENVPNKGYNFCEECRNEVLTPIKVEEVQADHEYDFDSFFFPMLKTDTPPEDTF